MWEPQSSRPLFLFLFAFLPVCPCHHCAHLNFSDSSYRPPAVIFPLSKVFSFIPALPFSWIIYALGVGSHCGMLFEPQPQYYSVTVDVLEGEEERPKAAKGLMGSLFFFGPSCFMHHLLINSQSQLIVHKTRERKCSCCLHKADEKLLAVGSDCVCVCVRAQAWCLTLTAGSQWSHVKGQSPAENWLTVNLRMPAIIFSLTLPLPPLSALWQWYIGLQMAL